MYRFTILLLIIFLVSCKDQQAKQEGIDTQLLIETLENATKNGDSILDPATAEMVKELVTNLKSKWTEVKSEEGNFRIEFPRDEVIEKQTTQIIDGKEVVIHSYTVKTPDKEDDNLAYMIDYCLMPEIKTKEQIENEFNIQREYVLRGTNSKLEYEYVIDSINYRGRELYFTVDGTKTKVRYNLYFNDGIFYKVTVVTENGKLFNNSINRFIKSFRILKNKR